MSIHKLYLNKQDQTVPGEYPAVVGNSRRPDLLRSVNQIPLLKYQAIALVEGLAEEYALNRFRVQFTRSTRAYCRRDEDGFITIALAPIPLNGTPGVGLCVGMVVHEFTHAVILERGPDLWKLHGPEFTAVMDVILEDLEKHGMPGRWLSGLSLTQPQPATSE